ncbi:MAG TPA: hypothetical protein VFD03_03780, partial [Clostridia bacterium]|nr:hypothetical protein [Clostridia bacterium]
MFWDRLVYNIRVPVPVVHTAYCEIHRRSHISRIGSKSTTYAKVAELSEVEKMRSASLLIPV